jgi:anti-sigma regulatory factor (Ser/Thr protein kinase)
MSLTSRQHKAAAPKTLKISIVTCSTSKYDEKKLVIIIQDWGESFKLDPSRSYDVEQAVKDRRIGGFGMHIIRRSMDEIRYLSDS